MKNLFIIPSWYPSEAYPSTGIFFREQAQVIARQRPDWRIGISTWGSHDPRYWMLTAKPLEAFTKYYSRMQMRQYEYMLEPNCVELLFPAFTWTRKIFGGNIEGIVAANEKNLHRFMLHFGKPNVIHAHVAYPAGYIAQRLSEKYAIPFVITEHMSPFPMPSLRSLLNKRLIPTLRHASSVLAVSDHLVATLDKYGVKAQKANNFIDDDFFYPIENPITNHQFIFLAVGRLAPQKDFNTLIGAAALVAQTGGTFELRIIGEGSDRRKLTRLVNDLNLENHITFLGQCDRLQVRDELRKCDALVMSSLHENQPVAVLEALACGKPVVSTRWKGADEMVTEEVGKLSEVGNATDLAKMMSSQMNNPRTPQPIRAYYMHHYAAEKSVSVLEDVYKSVIRFLE